jgi:hypothetical protein
MQFVPDLTFVLKKAWSMRIFLLIATISACVTIAEFTLANSGEQITQYLPTGFYPALMAILSILGMYFRTVLQKKTDEMVNKDDQQVPENN